MEEKIENSTVSRLSLSISESTITIGGGSSDVSENVLVKNAPSSNITWKVVLQNLLYILCWYFFSTALSFYNKQLMGKDHFNLRLPILVSALHSGLNFVMTLILMRGYLPFLYKKPERSYVSSDSYLTRIVPCALGSALEICMANASLVFITLSFYTMVKSSTPVWVLMFAFLFKLEKPRVILVFIITIISTGVVMTVFGETQFNLIGFLLVLGAAVISGLRWSIAQILLQKEEAINNPIATLYYLSPIMFGAMLLLSLIFENPLDVFYTSSHFSDLATSMQTLGLMLVGGFLAFSMTVAEFALIKSTSTVTLSVAGISKEIVVIALSIFIYNDQFTLLNLIGLLISISGIAGYNYYKITKGASANNDKKGKYQALPIHKSNQ